MMAEGLEGFGSFHDARFECADFSGAMLRDCNVRGLRIVDARLADIRLEGLLESVIINDVDVTAFVEAELDRRCPERVQLRTLQTATDFQLMWATIERLWSDAVAQAESLPEWTRNERVDDEWSFTETLRHIVFAVDAWVSRTILDLPMPYARIGLPQTSYEHDIVASIGIDLSAEPSYDEVIEVWGSRMAVVGGVVDALTDAELDRECTRTPGPGYPEGAIAVRRCLRVLMNEACDHRRYAVRDLTILEGRL